MLAGRRRRRMQPGLAVVEEDEQGHLAVRMRQPVAGELSDAAVFLGVGEFQLYGLLAQLVQLLALLTGHPLPQLLHQRLVHQTLYLPPILAPRAFLSLLAALARLAAIFLHHHPLAVYSAFSYR